MLQNQFANIGDHMFDKDTAKIVRSHAFWGGFIMALPAFGIDWLIFAIILWDMYASLSKRAGKQFGCGSVIVGIISNLVVGIGLDLLLSFIPVIGWLGILFIVYLQFYFSGKAYIETLKKM
ncbi:MAG: hypothetical protein ACI4AM_04900 [Muribaculaceae bacterium]